MRLMHPLLEEPIHFEENQVQVLVVEKPSVFRQIVGELIDQSAGNQGQFVLSLNFGVLDCGLHLHTVCDFFHLEQWNKRIQNQFLTHVQHIVQEELQQEKESLIRTLNSFLCKISEKLDVPTIFDVGDNTNALLKFADFHLSLDDMEPMEALIEHLSVCAAFIKNPCFALIGAKQYFETEEIEALYKIAVYKKWRLLLVEPFAATDRLRFENIRIIDRDLCILRLQ